MSNTKKRSGGKKSTGALDRKRKATRKGKKGLGGLAVPSKEVVLDSLKKTGLVGLGFLGGRLISANIFPSETGFKKYAATIIEAGGGVLLAAQNKSQTAKFIGFGLSASGGLDLAEKIFDKQILPINLSLSGFSLGDVFGKSPENKIENPPYKPNLPEIPADTIVEFEEEHASGASGIGNSDSEIM
ncbi:hypothetical protein SDC9_53750 [bioreactor metagenome]|uniref:Uncharacterized protein n=1 Tax=bioreactor metagenome TaxID=1076179 RepID=A0A644WZT7_9ZZZZ